MALYAFDGTWNKEHNAGEYGKNTNVVRFKNLYTGPKFFYVGVGNKHGFLGKVFGGAFGAGGHERIAEATQNLSDQLAKGDSIVDIIGFSRGAALALHFTNVVAGGIKVRTANGTETLKPEVRFLGLWDVVAAFGIAIDIGIEFSRINLGYKLKLGPHVKYCFHALALDEHRQAFRPTRTPNGYEVWFRGVHSDIGGGDENAGLNDITMRWMLRKAIAVGLPLPPGSDVVNTGAWNADAAVGTNFDVLQPITRDVSKTDRMHYSVSARPKCVGPIEGCPQESAQMELQAQPLTMT